MLFPMKSYVTLGSLTCLCAKEALRAGYEYFGLIEKGINLLPERLMKASYCTQCKEA